ncbi:CCQ_1a_G0006420.mRNA.1.CDS.1 [Saccharomyces cerevisiae]|nr:CCQ_1a_G0006420.mRNA.1.CDS.1 [Saccharomyces cerevisiae]CAI7173418.1 CCQ_1a_G0006420.mRNA.1.CDS.1 [Saccharomyces cerevisiae]
MSQQLFPGFTSEFIQTERGTFYVRRSPKKDRSLLLLHGFPQSHACWSKIAPSLSEEYSVICMDLVGYGLSDAPAGDTAHKRYSKNEMAKDCLAVMDSLSIESFAVAGHDRGALVAVQLGLSSNRIEKLILLDNLPCLLLWDRIASDPSFIPHWRELASPEAEALLSQEWLEKFMQGETASGSLDDFPPASMESYRRSWRDPDRIHAFCEDYRAGAGPDVQLEKRDYSNGCTIKVPSLVIWGEDFLGKLEESPVSAWRRTFVPAIKGHEVPGGHFNAEEAPDQTLRAMIDFLKS